MHEGMRARGKREEEGGGGWKLHLTGRSRLGKCKGDGGICCLLPPWHRVEVASERADRGAPADQSTDPACCRRGSSGCEKSRKRVLELSSCSMQTARCGLTGSCIS